ncbi:hypothetical protein JP0568_04120 [Helicobacter pylori]|uniref:hypothetical protein n=1 Tax=Helicobacter pylori TaxID=210 RepID=UPI00214C55D4|nr:hypothetical protein [Helicobacter pylori]
MAEWKTDTEEVKQIVKKCRDFKGSLLKNRDLGFDATELEQIEKVSFLGGICGILMRMFWGIWRW